MGYHVKMTNIDAMYDQYLTAAAPDASVLGEALDALAAAVTTFHSMDSFKGAAAQAVKAYLMDAHSVIIANLKELCGLLQTDYAVRYLRRYSEVPIAEEGSAVLPEDEMEQKRGLLAQAKDERVPSIANEVTTAYRLLPSGNWPAQPSTEGLRKAFSEAHSDLELVKCNVRTVEELGRAHFLNSATVTELFARLREAIQDTALDASAVKGYEAGSFLRSSLGQALSKAGQEAHSWREESAEVLITVQDQMLDRQILREEEAFHLMEEGRSQWEMVGIAGSAISSLASAAAILGTGGAAAVVAGAGALKSISGTVTRVQEYASGKNVSTNPEGDAAAKSLKSSIGSTTASSVLTSISSLAKGKSNPLKVLSSSAKGAVSLAGKASQAVTIVADANQTRMREEAQARLQRVEALKARRSAQAA